MRVNGSMGWELRYCWPMKALRKCERWQRWGGGATGGEKGFRHVKNIIARELGWEFK